MEKRQSKNSEFLTRMITGALITAAIVLILVFSKISLLIEITNAVLALSVMFEMLRAVGFLDRLYVSLPVFVVSALLPFISLPYFTCLLTAAFVIYLALSGVLMRCANRGTRPSAPVYLVFILAVLIILQAFRELAGQHNGIYYLSFAVLSTFATDIFAYLVGRRFGKHKPFPSVSPGKSVEGCIGGMIACVAVCALYCFALSSFTEIKANYLISVAFAVLVSAFDQFGDLAMSALKRTCCIKDFGRLLPGHGGVLDRFDSMIPVTALLYLGSCIL